MNNDNRIKDLAFRIASMAEEIGRVQRELRDLKNTLPKEPSASGTVISFEKSFGSIPLPDEL